MTGPEEHDDRNRRFEFRADPDRKRVRLTRPGTGIGVVAVFVVGALVILGVMAVIAAHVLR